MLQAAVRQHTQNMLDDLHLLWCTRFVVPSCHVLLALHDDYSVGVIKAFIHTIVINYRYAWH